MFLLSKQFEFLRCCSVCNIPRALWGTAVPSLRELFGGGEAARADVRGHAGRMARYFIIRLLCEQSQETVLSVGPCIHPLCLTLLTVQPRVFHTRLALVRFPRRLSKCVSHARVRLRRLRRCLVHIYIYIYIYISLPH